MVIVLGCLVFIDFICCVYINIVLNQILNRMDAKILLNISDARLLRHSARCRRMKLLSLILYRAREARPTVPSRGTIGP